ncbi:MAG TPA: SDR family NAD(P)-dependent oxidoreductase [Geminicoccaceae bacterium]|nr:SDR family NAD(P)-dependent oxidoreductase [Geminicoccaceae bacterium]
MTEPSFRLDDQLALVSGAGRGIGRGCALALAAAGAEVIALSRTAAELEALVGEIEAEGGRARALVCDVTDTAAVRSAIEGLTTLDVLVNNAGSNRPQPFLEVEDAVLDRMLNLNLKAAFVVAQAAARVMARSGGGAIINMSSQMGHVGGATRTVYCATKHGLEGLTKAMAIDLAPHKIRVNSVAPTFVETPLTRPFFEDPSFKARVLDQILLGRLARIDEIAAAVVFLASPAAAMITGTSLLVDGGWTAH